MGKYDNKIKDDLGFYSAGDKMYYGVYNGYEVTLNMTQSGYDFYVNFYAEINKKYSLLDLMRNHAVLNKIKINQTEHGLSSSIIGMTYNSTTKKLKNILDEITKILKSRDIPGCGTCPFCGKPDANVKIKINDACATVDEECNENISANVRELNLKYDLEPNNYLKGSIGAVLGALVAALAYVLLYIIGFYSALTAVLAVFLGSQFYVKLGGKSTKIKYVIVISVSFVVIMLTWFLTNYIHVSTLLKENEIEEKALKYIMDNKELKIIFIRDLIMNIGFTILGSISQFLYEKRKDSKSRVSYSKTK